MCLHDMLCGSLEVIKFDIELVVLYFFESLISFWFWNALCTI